MKLFILSLLILSTLTFRINVPSTLNFESSNAQIQLSTQGGNGQVGYRVQGLPEGFVINNNRLVYYGSARLEGRYPATIIANDEQGNSARQVVVININTNNGAQAVSGASNVNANTGSVFVTSTGSNGAVNVNGGSIVITSTVTSDATATGGSATGATGSANVGGAALPIGWSTGQSTLSPAQLLNVYNTGASNNVVQTRTISSYPTPVVITGGNLPNQVPNTEIITVTSAQGARSNAGVKTLTQYDTKISDLFNQQTQIGHTIGNLLQIVRQGAANRQKLQVDIDGLTKRLATQVQAQQQQALTISAEQANVRNIQAAITNANNQLNGLNGNVNTLNDQINQARRNGLQQTQKLNIAINNRDGLRGQITNARQGIKGLNANAQSSRQVCDEVDAAINRLNGNVSTLTGSIAGLDQRIGAIDRQIGDHQKQIAALQAQIAALNGRISQARVDRQALVNLNFTVPQQIATLNAQIAAQRQRCANAGGNNGDLKGAQDGLADLQKRQLGANNDIVVITAQINLLRSNLDELLARNGTLFASIRDTQNNINTLRAQLPELQNKLNRLYLNANRAIQTARTTNETLGAAVIRLKRESDALAIANLNLQQARAQAQKIRVQINTLLQQNTAGLPFPSAPLTTGLNGQVAQINSIDSINLFLLNAYGSSFEFENYYRQFASVSSLYRFGSSNSLLSNCAISKQKDGNQLLSANGKITSIGQDHIKVSTEQGQQTLSVDGCSLKLANVNNYNYSVGDSIVWKGYYNQANSAWNVAQLTCLH